MASAAVAAGTQDQLANEDYTVGWICALTTEYVAAQVFLDQEHMPPTFTATHDNNDYTLGRIGQHNVVIAILPGGEYGIASAATVGRDMLHTFPNIRIGLMVGIGGGAPTSKHDIRLGDVVVSEPRDGLAGVFQYDYGKNIQDQPFHKTGFLAPPPPILLTATSGLRAKYERYGHSIHQDIMTRLVAEKRLKRKYSRPAADTDCLYRSHVIHSQSESSCLDNCGRDAQSVSIRTARDEDEDDPAIHYGLIASANQLMKDAKLRDQYANEKGVLCFEMEAAGLVNHFPCLIIRGICDYADSHKNKEWQGYAAMTAAAYARDLLYKISPKKVEGEKKLVELVENISEAIRTTSEVVTRIESTVAKDEDDKILNWLTPTPIDYGSQYSDLLKVRQLGTGQWFLESTQYQTWLATQKQTLFCPGIPGAGKTILASIAISDLFHRFERVKDVGIAYIYCNFQSQEKQKIDHLLASLLRQLAQRWPYLPQEVKFLYDNHKVKQTKPSVDEISNALQSVARLYSRVFIVIDALDECETECRSTFLSQMFSLQAGTTANILATSRPIRTIEKDFKGRSDMVKISARDEDVERCLDNDMKTLPLLGKDNEGLSEKSKQDLRTKIRTTIVEGVNGMFLLARLQLASLIDKTTVYEVNTALESLPKGRNALSQAYGLTMERIRDQRPGFRYLAERVLTLLTCARRPLSTSELKDALAVTEGDASLDKTKRGHTSIIVSVCAGLVTVDADSDIIRLVHKTTREYLANHMNCILPQYALATIANPMEIDDEENRIAMAKAHQSFAIICVTYLLFDVFESGSCQTGTELKERLQLHQLYDYAAHNWGHHAREASTYCPSFKRFLNDSPKREASIQVLIPNDLSLMVKYSIMVRQRVTGLHLAAYFGITETVRILLEDCQNIDQRDQSDKTPLIYAAESGRESIVRLLLATEKVDINAKDHCGQTPLTYAAKSGYESIIRLLLATEKVDINAKDHCGQTPLTYAAKSGYESIIRLLLATEKVHVTEKDFFSQTPLLYAVERGHEAIVKLLLATEKVQFNVEDNGGWTPLLCAVERGHEAIVKLLLATEKVQVNAGDDGGRTPLSYAAGDGHEAIVKLLLATEKVQVNAGDKRGRTPLWYAANNEHEGIVKLLRAAEKADANAGDDRGRTPLSYAAEDGHKDIVKLLLATEKVQVNAGDKRGQTPLWYAAENGHEGIVKLLLAAEKADANAKNDSSQTDKPD
ncbi:hypothetical protein MY10362_004646 [Beauveria mimosiformis]